MKTKQSSPPEGVRCSAGLAAGGWREWRNQFKSYGRCFYKRFATPTVCACNRDKPGMQVELTVGERDGIESFEMELCGQLRDGTWLRLHQFALPADDLGAALALVPRMLAIWEAANGCKLSDASWRGRTRDALSALPP